MLQALIFIVWSDVLPVDKIEQHVEISRDTAEKFNTFGETLNYRKR